MGDDLSENTFFMDMELALTESCPSEDAYKPLIASESPSKKLLEEKSVLEHLSEAYPEATPKEKDFWATLSQRLSKSGFEKLASFSLSQIK